MYANRLDDKSLLIKGYILINLCIFNVLTTWMFFEMNCVVCQKMMVEVTFSEDLQMVVSKIKWN